jgi:hypothetical protein
MNLEPAENPYQTPAAAALVDPDEHPPLKDPRLLGWLAVISISLVSLFEIARGLIANFLMEAWMVSFAVTTLSAVVFYLLWIHRCATNSRLLNRRSDIKPGWVVWSHFIPFANWVVPCLSVKAIAHETFRHRPMPGIQPIIIVWWLAFLTRSLSSRAPASDAIHLIWMGSTLLAWLTISFLIAMISHRQSSFRWSDVPAANLPQMLPMRTSSPVHAPLRPSGSLIPPPRKILLPVKTVEPIQGTDDRA